LSTVALALASSLTLDSFSSFSFDDFTLDAVDAVFAAVTSIDDSRRCVRACAKAKMCVRCNTKYVSVYTFKQTEQHL
jgi:hypothetical protein